MIGDKNFTEEYILGSLYQQALAAKGYKVTLKGNIGSSEITYKALTVGPDPDVPRVHRDAADRDRRRHQRRRTAPQQTYAQAQAYVEKHGFTLLNQTPFSDSDALGGARRRSHQAHHLTTIADLEEARASR